MTYHDAFDQIGNPVAHPPRVHFLQRISKATDADGVYIIGGVVLALALLGMWFCGAQV
jgi:hypothetical protein